MIHIEKIFIEGFINKQQNLEFNFADGNITVVYGINGSGKTTFLEILYAIFAQDGSIFDRFNISKIELEYSQNHNKETLIIKESKEIDDEYIFSQNYEAKIETVENFIPFQQSTISQLSSLFLGIGRGVEQKVEAISISDAVNFFQKNEQLKEVQNILKHYIYDFDKDFKDILNILSENLYDYLNQKDKKAIRQAKLYQIRDENIKESNYLPSIDISLVEAIISYRYKETVEKTREKIQKSFIDTLSTLIDDKKSKIDLDELNSKLLKNKNLILEALNRDNSLKFKKQIEDILDNLNNREYLSLQNDLIKTILFNMVKEITNEVEIFNRLKLFETEFNNFLQENNKKIVITEDEIKIYLDDFDTSHSLDRLSSGERHLLTFLATILLLGEKKDFILIDEPEISLNINWQVDILSIVNKLVPNSQIIVATHSPMTAEEYPDTLVEIEPKKVI